MVCPAIPGKVRLCYDCRRINIMKAGDLTNTVIITDTEVGDNIVAITIYVIFQFDASAVQCDPCQLKLLLV